MRQTTLLLLILLCFSAKAQKWKLGFRGGASFANFYDHNASDSRSTNTYAFYKTDFIKDLKKGFFSELFVNWRWTKKLTLEAGIGYYQKGIDLHYHSNTRTVNSDNSVTKTSHQFNRDLRSNYIAIPMVFQYTLGKKECFYVLGGVYHAAGIKYVINEASIVDTWETEDSSDLPLAKTISVTNITSTDVRILDGGLVAGFGMEWPMMKRWRIGLEARTNLGLISLPPEGQVGFFDFSTDAKNINIETGLKFSRSIN